MKASSRDFLHLHFIVLVWGFTAILGKLIQLPPVELVFYRTVLAAIGIGIYARIKGGGVEVDFDTAVSLMLIGGLVAVHWILFFLSARIANISVSLVGIATTAFWTSLLEPLMTKRKFIWIEVVLGIFVVLGIYIIFYYEFTVAIGLMIAIISAMVASIFTIINSKFAKNSSHYSIAFFEMSGAAILITIFFPVYSLYFAEGNQLQLSMKWMDLLYLALLAFICTDYAYTASIHLMKKISAYAINLTVNLEPVYGILLAVIVFKEDEKMNFQFYMGAILIIISVLAYPVLNRYYTRKNLEVDNLR